MLAIDGKKEKKRKKHDRQIEYNFLFHFFFNLHFFLPTFNFPRFFFFAGRKPTHDFLSLYSHSTTQQDPRPPSQGIPFLLQIFFFYINNFFLFLNLRSEILFYFLYYFNLGHFVGNK